MVLVGLDGDADRAVLNSWQAEGMRASASGCVNLTGLEVGPEALIGRPGDYTREPDFTGGAVRFAAVQLGGAQALLHAAANSLRQAGRTGDPHQRARMGAAAIAVETGALWLLGTARLWEGGAAPDAIVAYAQMTRTAIERVCLDVLELVDRSVGARGLLPPSPVERVGRDLRLYLRQPAPDATLDAVGEAVLDRPGLALGSSPDLHD
jgi:alkylation response protein AidB-like acyl-CoA dehydrogenase